MRLTARETLDRLIDGRVIGAEYTEAETIKIAEAIGRGFDVFTVEDVAAFQRWAFELMVKAALLTLVLDGKMIARMHADDEEPEFVLFKDLAKVPRAPESQRRVREDHRIPASTQPPSKNPDAVALGRRGGLKGGPARAAAMTSDERSDAARTAANARWGPPMYCLTVGCKEEVSAGMCAAGHTAPEAFDACRECGGLFGNHAGKQHQFELSPGAARATTV